MMRKIISEVVKFVRNNIRSSKIREINVEGAKTKVLIIPTNEELEIARQSFELLR